VLQCIAIIVAEWDSNGNGESAEREIDKVSPNVPRNSATVVNVVYFILAADDDLWPSWGEVQIEGIVTRDMSLAQRDVHVRTHARTLLTRYDIQRCTFSQAASPFIVTDPLLRADESCPLASNNGEKG